MLSPCHLHAISREHVLNGIAHDEQGDRLFVTGKCWPNIFQVPPNPNPNPNPNPSARNSVHQSPEPCVVEVPS